MDGVNINTDDLILKAKKGGVSITDKVRINVALDIDTDSDNDDDIVTTDTVEDKDEDWAAIDPDKLGKRLFLNWDDDNENAEEDQFDNQLGYIGAVDDDLVEVTAQFTETNMHGYKVVLEHASNLAIYVSAPVKAFEQIGESPIQANVTGLNPTVVTAL